MRNIGEEDDNLKKMFQNYIWIIIVNLYSLVIVYATEVTNTHENCMVSFSVPKESLKAVCDEDRGYHTQQKLKSVESQLTTIRREMNDLHIRLTKTVSYSNQASKVDELSDRLERLEASIIPKLEQAVADVQNNLADDSSNEADETKMTLVDVFGKKRLAKQVRMQIRKEMEDIKETVKVEIHKEVIQEIKEEIRNEFLSYTKKDSKLLNGINTEILLNTISGFDDEEFEKANKQNHYKESGGIFAKPHQEKTMVHDTYEDFKSAVENEFPENVHSHFLRDDSKATPALSHAVNVLHREVKKHLDEQTKQVKEVVGKYLNQAVSVCENAEESMNRKFEMQLESIKEEMMKDNKIQRRFDKLENDVDTVVQAVNSLKAYEDETEERNKIEKRTLETYVTATLGRSSENFQAELEQLRNQTGTLSKLTHVNAQLQRVTEISIRHINASLRITSDVIEENITRIMKQIDILNKTINPDYSQLDIDDTLHQIEVEDTINFVKDFKKIWPLALNNITAQNETNLKNIEEVGRKIDKIVYQLNSVNNNEGNLNQSIQKLLHEVRQLQETIAYNAKVERESAFENNNWAQYNFNTSYSGRSECFGKKYVKKTSYSVGVYVGVVLCSSKRYKIYLADSLTDTFLDIGDTKESGEDHCEFVGAAQNSSITIKKHENVFEAIPGYKRADWGQVPEKSMLFFFSPTPAWYECGVTIP